MHTHAENVFEFEMVLRGKPKRFDLPPFTAFLGKNFFARGGGVHDFGAFHFRRNGLSTAVKQGKFTVNQIISFRWPGLATGCEPELKDIL